ncbi:unnamed protein product [marine sediment metagenome]|uniref:Uncharacterized protein n=1 Tax=marine sediment metagenome TaxID=412755 RepID=X1FX97_9ZZZZ
MDVRVKLKTVLTKEEKERLKKIIESVDKRISNWMLDEFAELSVLLWGLYSNLGFHPDIVRKLISQMKEGIAKKWAIKTFELAKECDRFVKKT